METSNVDDSNVKKRNRGNIRKRPVDEAGLDEENETAINRRSKLEKGLTFSTKREEQGDLTVNYVSSRALGSASDVLATKTLETEVDLDAAARDASNRGASSSGQGVAESKTYQGMKQYVDYREGFRREGTTGSDKALGHGPLKANVFIRVSARMDYQPDICKDYKETGFCSYGDSCKFLHDRGDYKSGWELERDWQSEQKIKMDALLGRGTKDRSEIDDGGGDEDGVPFACYICRKPWQEAKNPVMTKCKHYFCEKCALKHNAKSTKCAACSAVTNGIFNVASDVLKKLKAAGVDK